MAGDFCKEGKKEELGTGCKLGNIEDIYIPLRERGFDRAND